jgi:phosphoribosyl 1,2-cyclic phosphodiesterase
VPVSHDCSPTVMFKFFAPGGLRIGMLTDLGAYEPRHGELFGDCELLLLESNHCPELLRRGPYPAQLKARIAGSRGHLSNTQALEFVLGLPRLPRELILGHLSDTNNTAQAASSLFEAAVSSSSLPLFLERGSTDAHGGGIPHRVLVQMTPGPMLEL